MNALKHELTGQKILLPSEDAIGATLILVGKKAYRVAHNGLGIILAIAIISLSAAAANAQGPVISGVTVDSISYSTARIQWTSSIATGTARVQYDSLTSTLPFANSTQFKNGAAGTVQGYTLGGLAPATTYYFVACSTASSTETCSSVGNFTTAAAPSGWPAILPTPILPTAPTLPAMPTISGTTYTVGSNCNDGTTGLQAYLNTAAAVGGSANQQILIPPSTSCLGNYELPTNTGTGWIVVRTSAPDSSLPPQGVRIDSTYTSVMPVISALNTGGNQLSGAIYTTNSGTSNWRFVGIQFTSQTGSHEDLICMQAGQTSNMIIDRTIFFANGGAGDAVSVGIIADGSQTVIANNSITIVDPGQYGTAIEVTGAQGILIDNNYIDAPGISVFSQENALFGADVPQGGNYQISRNFFAWDPAFINNSFARQHVEFKAGSKILINGNTFTSEWTGGNTGGYSNAIALNPRNGQNTDTFSNYLSDITITNNDFHGVPGGVGLWGSQNNLVVMDVPATKRVLIQNNLMYAINGFYGSTGHTVNGAIFELRASLEGVLISHNSIYGNRGNFPEIFDWSAGPGASIRFTNNILPATSTNNSGNLRWDGDTSGQLPAPTFSQTTPIPVWHGVATANPNPDPASQFVGNALVPGVTDTSVDANYANASYAYTPATCTSYWAYLSNLCAGNGGTTTANQVMQSIGLWGPIANTSGYATVANWRFIYSSPYISGAHYTTDGLDAGANIDQLEAAQGVVSNVHTFSTTSTATTVGFLAPDSFACSIDVDPSSDSGNFTPGVFSRVSGSGGQRVQNVSLTGLTAHVQYTLRVNCSSQQPKITIQLP